MSGARPLALHEILAMTAATRSRLAVGLILLGTATGYRVSELLSMRVRDVWYNDQPADTVVVSRSCMKFGRSTVHRRSVRGRSVPLNDDAKAAVRLLVGQDAHPARFLFASRKGRNRPIHVQHAIRLIHDAATAAGIDPRRVTTHALRKTFAMGLYEVTGNDLNAVRHGLGHRSVETTRRYLDLDEARVASAILALAHRHSPTPITPHWPPPVEAPALAFAVPLPA